MRSVSHIAVCCLCVLVAGCREFPNPFAGEKPLARAGERELYFSQIRSIFTPGLSPADSLQLLGSYVDMWVRKQLKVQEAEKRFSESEADIDRMVEEYRQSLLNVRLDQYYIDRMLDTTVTEQQVEEYYTAHRGDFTLDRAIVKGAVVRLPAGYRQAAQLKKLMASERANDRQDFLDICAKNNFTLVEFTRWTDLSEFLAQLPGNRPDDGEVVRKTEVQELAAGGDRYLFRITERRSAGDAVPIERVVAVIRRVVYNQRKSDIVRWYEDSLYNAAVRENRVDVGVK